MAEFMYKRLKRNKVLPETLVNLINKTQRVNYNKKMK